LSAKIGERSRRLFSQLAKFDRAEDYYAQYQSDGSDRASRCSDAAIGMSSNDESEDTGSDLLTLRGETQDQF